jgi:hypothetical protein
MTDVLPAGAARGFRVKVWHLSLAVLYVAVAIKDVQDHAPAEPAMIALAAAGFAGYAMLACAGWLVARRFGARVRLRPVALFGLYAVAMAGLFFGATVIYLVVEYAYVTGRV